MWGAAGVLAATSTVWATHFIAMLAFEPGLHFRFDAARTVLSFLVAVALVGAGATVAATMPRPAGRAAGGAIIGIAISAMHYTGMSAFQVQGHLSWDATLVVASVLSGIVLAGAAVLMTSSARIPAVCGPLLLVLAVCLAHFGGMGAVTVELDPTVVEPGGRVDKAFLAMLVTNVSLLIVGTSLVAAWLSGRLRRQLATEDLRLRDLTDIAIDGLLLCRCDETIVRANRSLERMLGCEGGELIGRRLSDVVHGIASVPTEKEVDAFLSYRLATRIPVRVVGREIAIGGRHHVVVAVRDQRERLRNESKMMRLAHHDSLTGLANRLHLTETLAARLLLPSCEDSLALILLDLDRFKAVNDTLGHGMGDELLRRVAGRLRRAVRGDDLVARLGGDEFAIIANVDGNLDAVRRIATSIIDLLDRPFLIDGQIIDISTSVGIALAPTDGDEPTQLSRSADLALYSAKQNGGRAYRFFEATMSLEVQARRALELDLRRAAARQEFEVYYQPQVDPRTGAFDGAEALLRWRHPQRGMVPPSDFIPLAEEIGLIGSIGEWVLRTACEEATRWPEHLSVAVNVSPVQFRDPQLADNVAAILAETGLSGSRLELEVTETALMQDDGHTLEILHALRALGVRISMDDFGTGYSSLSYLRRFPFDKIKIDQSFIRQVPLDEDSVAIVQAITTLGLKLGMTVTVEGVETLEQRIFTASEGCDQIQGYLISRPVPATQLRELLVAPAAAMSLTPV